MKTYKANQHGKLDTAERQEAFIGFMKQEYAGYIDNDTLEISAHNDGDFDWFVSEFLQWWNKEETIFSIESKKGAITWYVDYQRRRNIYNVSLDEKFKVQRKSLGEALEYIFGFLNGKHLKVTQ